MHTGHSNRERAPTGASSSKGAAIPSHEARAQLLADGASEGLLLLDPDFVVSAHNPAAAELLAFDPAGRSIGEVFRACASRLEQRLESYLNGIAPFKRVPIAAEVDGPPTWLVTARRTASKDAPLVLSIRSLADVETAQLEAVRTAQDAAIARMAIGLAHESRDALQIISAAAELLAMRLQHQEEYRPLIAGITTAQTTLHRLLDEVRSYAAPGPLSLRRANIREIWHRAWQSVIRRYEGSTATLQEAPSEVDLNVVLDVERMEQVFEHVFENALTAGRADVRVSIELQESNDGSGGAVAIRVKDNGPGMTDKVMQRAFEPFFSTKTASSGLGLAVARRGIESHGGTITLGDCREGAELLIVLPREQQ